MEGGFTGTKGDSEPLRIYYRGSCPANRNGYEPGTREVDWGVIFSVDFILALLLLGSAAGFWTAGILYSQLLGMASLIAAGACYLPFLFRHTQPKSCGQEQQQSRASGGFIHRQKSHPVD